MLMNPARLAFAGYGLAVLIAACSSGGGATPPGGSGTQGSSTVGAGGASSAVDTSGASGPGGVSTTAGGASSTTGTDGTVTSGSDGTVTSGTNGTVTSGSDGTVTTTGSDGTTTTGTTTTTDGGTTGGTTTDGGTGGTGGMVTPDLPPLVTSAPGAYWKTDGALTEMAGATATVTVNDTQVAQNWDGFGGAFNERGWSYLTSADMQNQALMLLFSASDGANFAWGRIPMGASDYAIDRYTCDDTGSDVAPNGDESNRPAADTALANFSLDRDGQMLIPYIKAAQAVKSDLRFWASPWTPPVWMKTGYKTNSGADSSQPANKPSYFDGGNMKSDAATLTAYAQYYTKFVQGYMDQGINIEIVSPQNEPGYDQNYPSCLWDGSTYATFIGQYLGPAMQSLGVTVMLGTLSNANTDFDVAAAAIADSTAKSFLSVVGAQWNTLDQSRLSGLNSGLPVWATEHKCGNYPWNPSGYPAYVSSAAPNDQAYAVESWGYIRDAIKTIKVTSYNAWNMVLDKGGKGIDTTRDWAQNALLVADSGTVTATPVYYVFRHMSQYVAPGAVVVGTSGGDAVAFKNPDGSLVAVMFNSGSANNNYVVSMGGHSFQFAMPGNGWATVKYTP